MHITLSFPVECTFTCSTFQTQVPSPLLKHIFFKYMLISAYNKAHVPRKRMLIKRKKIQAL